MRPTPATRSPTCARATRCPRTTSCGSAASSTRTRASASPRSPRRRATCRSCSSARRRPWAHELPDVTLTGHVSDDDLAAIYTGARALVIASDDEGFGLPTVEALACGTPVVACDVPALREVLADRATFVGHDDLRGLLAAAAVAGRPAPAPPAWTWQDAARATWEVYAEAALPAVAAAAR